MAVTFKNGEIIPYNKASTYLPIPLTDIDNAHGVDHILFHAPSKSFVVVTVDDCSESFLDYELFKHLQHDKSAFSIPLGAL